MILEIKVFNYTCSLSVFKINGVEADEQDFVDKYDHEPNTVEYGCGNMRAEVVPATVEVLAKYQITLDEYREIAEDVAEKLSFGSCSGCS